MAKDFAHGRPSALDLGLSSNTASVEALKLILSRAAKGRMRIWGLDIPTAFLFANVVQPTVVELPSSFCLEGGGTAYLILEKGLVWFAQCEPKLAKAPQQNNGWSRTQGLAARAYAL